MSILQNLKWRYATKQFDASKKLSKQQLDTVLEATNLAATSYGLQPFDVLVVENPDIRKKLREAAWGQSQLTDASQIVVFAAKTNLSAAHVDEFVARISQTRGIPVETLADYRNMMVGSVEGRSPEARTQWAARQAYVALGTLLTASAAEGIDACPMEGFSPDQFDEILGLKEKNLTAVVIAALGFRSANDKYQHAAKVRRDIKDIVRFI
ncbi:MAG: NAD(P)H-dependent oxidoreductase [Breznakibacter sp.]